MKKISGLILAVFFCFFCLKDGLSIAAEGSIYDQLTSPGEDEIQWLWGEVASVDLKRNTLLVQYLDYETDQEKEVKFYVDDQTTYENAKSLVEIKPQDTVAIDYIISPGGGNLATNISLEKLENTDVSEEAMPADLGGLDNLDELQVAPQEKSAEEVKSQEAAVQEVAPPEKAENQVVISEEPAVSEKSETEKPSSENSNAMDPMPDTPSGQ
ncbi:MAG: hypothetical protein ABIA66_00715 [Candidatus Omnitrophota bacterium]